jgi:hypothetical protein
VSFFVGIQGFGKDIAQLLSDAGHDFVDKIRNVLGYGNLEIVQMLREIRFSFEVCKKRRYVPAMTEVEVLDLLNAKLLNVGDIISMQPEKSGARLEKTISEAKVLEDGQLELTRVVLADGKVINFTGRRRVYKSVGETFRAASEAITGKPEKGGGDWSHWRYGNRRLDQLQADYCLFRAGLRDRIAPPREKRAKGAALPKGAKGINRGELEHFAKNVVVLLESLDVTIVKAIVTTLARKYDRDTVVRSLAHLTFAFEIAPIGGSPLRPKRKIMLPLLQAGIIEPGVRLFHEFRESPAQTVEATIHDDGWIEYNGGRYDSPSGASKAASAGKHRDGLRFWHYHRSDGQTCMLGDIVNEYHRRQRSGAVTDGGQPPKATDESELIGREPIDFDRLDKDWLDEIGRKGEWVVFEKLNKDFPANQGFTVDWVSKTDRFFDHDIEVRKNGEVVWYVEVKTTIRGTEYARAFISDRELQCRDDHKNCHRLYLVVFKGSLNDPEPAIRLLSPDDYDLVPVKYRLNLRLGGSSVNP